jgi:hypothetical protein
MELIIDEEFKNLLPPLEDYELRWLEDDIIQNNGIRNPIVVWNNIIIDGHNRYDICKRNHFSMPTVNAPDWVQGRSDVIRWISLNQVGRRNATKEQIRYLLGKEYNEAKKERGGDQKSEDAKSIRQNDGMITETAEKVAVAHDVSPRTVERAGDFAEKVDALPAEEKQAVLKGEKKLSSPKPKTQKDTLAIDVIVEGLRGICREIEDGLDSLDSGAKGKIKAVCVRIMEKLQ